MLATDIWGPLGAILGLIGIALGGVLAWWFARGPRLVVQASGSTLVSTPSDDRIVVLYDGEPVPRVTQSLIWLWREGRGTIRASDVVTGDPVTVRVPASDRILYADVVAPSNPTNAVTVDFDRNNPEAGARVDFVFLDPRQGAVIEVLHTGESPEAVEVTGTIMGIPKGIVRVTEGLEVDIPVGLPGASPFSLSVTVPTHTIPRSLRTAYRVKMHRPPDAAGEIFVNAIRRILP